MPVSTRFNTELQLVDAAREFTYTVNPAWGENEFEVSGFAVTGGSDAACEHGASEALYQLGYRFWTPQKTTRPSSISGSGVTISRGEFVFPYQRIFFNYGFGSVSALDSSYSAWAKLNVVDDLRRPVGHAWPALISAINAEDGFFTANPTYITGSVGATNAGFNLNISEFDRNILSDRLAEYLAANLNEFNRASFDPQDGSPWPSEPVWGLANEVVEKVREVVPNALLGVYAYANHGVPVDFDCPHLYCQVALGFTSQGLGYPGLVDAWGSRTAEVALRGYGTIAAQGEWGPFEAGILRRSSFSDYPSFIASGANGVNMETTASWVPGIIGHYHAMRYWRDGVTTYENVLDDAVTRLFDDDSRVADLYTLWSEPAGGEFPNTIVRSNEIIASMPDTAYRLEFQQYMAWLMRLRLLSTGTETHSPEYFVRLEKLLRWSKGMELTGQVQYYAVARALANANTSANGRPDLSFNANAHWFRFPEAPTAQDFTDAAAVYAKLDERPEELEDTTLVVANTTPQTSETANLLTAGDYYCWGTARYAYIGPGTLTVNYDSPGPEDTVTEYEAGLHFVTINSNARVSFSGGLLFLYNFPGVRLEPSSFGGRRFIFLPKASRGQVRLTNARTSLHDVNGRYDISNFTPPFSTNLNNPQLMLPGMLRVDNTLTRGFGTYDNFNRWFSPSPYRMLMPKALAEREGLTFRIVGENEF